MEKVKIAICGACLVIVAILGYCYISEKQNEKYEYIVNSAISNIVDTVIEKYPDVREEEILNILRNTKNNKTNILKKYGYLDNENYIKKLEFLFRNSNFFSVCRAWHITRWWKSTIRVSICEVLEKHNASIARLGLKEVWNKIVAQRTET